MAERLLRGPAQRGRHAAVGRAGRAVMQGAVGDGDDGEAPWHDQTLPIAERMKLAEAARCGGG